jgi:multiple antibiotic resistance protein
MAGNITDDFVTALVTLLVTVGPADVAAVFLVLTASMPADVRRRLALEASLIAAGVLVAFALGGHRLLAALHVGVPAFQLAGGILLLLLSIDLLFARQSGLSSITPGEEREAAGHRHIAVFPLAIPLIAGPGSMTAVVLLMGGARDFAQPAAIIAALLLVMAITLAALLIATRLVRWLGVIGVNVVTRVSGLLLAALAMQFVLDGLAASGLFRS